MQRLIKLGCFAVLTTIIGFSLFLGMTLNIEGYNSIFPDINTVYTAGFTQEKFGHIEAKMTPEDVLGLLGEPFIKSDQYGYWYYSSQGKEYHYAWIGKIVHFGSNGLVTRTESNIHFD